MEMQKLEKKPAISINFGEKRNIETENDFKQALFVDTSKHKEFILLVNNISNSSEECILKILSTIYDTGDPLVEPEKYHDQTGERTIVAGTNDPIILPCIGKKVLVLVKSSVTDTPATLDMLVRLNPKLREVS